MSGYNIENYHTSIIKLSESNNLKVAISEWIIEDIFYSENSKECLCGYYPINKCCVIRNLKNNKVAVVGVVCAEYFIDDSRVQQSIEEITIDDTKSLTPDALCAAARSINLWEFKFLSDLCGVPWEELTPWQKNCRMKINHGIFQ